MTAKSIEVIMAAYNNVTDMQLVFEGYLNQTEHNFSICICDDGSGPEVKSLIDDYCEKGLKVRHLWQEDHGFRKAKVVNQGIASSSAKFIILTDNDCIPSRHFINDYSKILRNDTMFFGRRVDLYEPSSNIIRKNTESLHLLDNPVWLLMQAARKGLKRPEMGIRFPLFVRKLWNQKKRGAIGANLAIPRQALLDVNGFDEDYEGYGMEESDLVWRLSKNGIKTQTVLGQCALFHLYHREKQQGPEAGIMFEQKKLLKQIKCLNGIKKIRPNK
ncbi:glycosyltransferase [Vibrio cionasavignyae]|uniref:glycosyltransferase n=1 Tax=Vibrio cionasavignyae TaxID=2910252 RepID=UPI003D120A98